MGTRLGDIRGGDGYVVESVIEILIKNTRAGAVILKIKIFKLV